MVDWWLGWRPACLLACSVCTVSSRLAASRLVLLLPLVPLRPHLRHAPALQWLTFFFFCVEGFQKIARWLLALNLMLSAPWPPSVCDRLSPRRQKIGGAAMTWPVV